MKNNEKLFACIMLGDPRPHFIQAVRLHVEKLYYEYFPSDKLSVVFPVEVFTDNAEEYAEKYITTKRDAFTVKLDPLDIAKRSILHTCVNIVDFNDADFPFVVKTLFDVAGDRYSSFYGREAELEDDIWCFNSDVQDTVRKEHPYKGDIYEQKQGYWIAQNHSGED